MDELTSKAIRRDIDSIKKTLVSIDKTLALQHLSLETHIKRTDLLEKKLEPVEEHVQQVRGAGKFIGLLALIAAIVSAFVIFR